MPIVVLHLHLRRRRVVEVSSLLLWRGVMADRVGRGRMRNLRDGIALALVLAALAAFTAAAAGPVRGESPTDPRRLAIVIDASATMNAGGRFGQAIAAARAAVQTQAPQDQVAVWLATQTPHLLVDPTRDHAAALRALDAATATLEPSTVATTTRLARSAAAGVAKLPATVLVLTDEIGAEALKDLPPSDVDVRVGVVDAGRAAKNAGIVACDVDPDDPGRVIVRVATTDGPPVQRSLRVSSTGEVVPLTFDADGNATASLALGAVSAAGGAVEVALEPADDFVHDDTARLVLPVAKPLAVAVVAAAPSPFLVEALRAMPAVVAAERTTLVAPGAPASAFDGIDVVITDGAAAPSGRPVLAFGVAGPVVQRPLLWGVGTHPVLAGVDLSPLRIETAVRLEPSAGDTTIVASAAGAVGVAGERGGIRHVTLGFRPDASTLPLEAAFPLLVRNSLRWLARPSDVPRYVVAGEPVPDGGGAVVPFPAPGGDRTFRLKSGEETAVRWIPPRGFRLSPASPLAATSADAAVASLPDRHSDADTRDRLGPRLAALGAGLLAIGALLLRQRRPAAIALPPATGIAWASASREEATSTRP